MTMSTQSRLTLASLFALIESADWPDHMKRDVKSSIRTVARLLGSDPGDIDVDPAALRRQLETILPEASGMTRARWNNVRSLFGKAVGLAKPLLPGRSKEPVHPEWQRLLAPLPENHRWKLTPLMRFLSGRGVLPDRVTVEDLMSYRDAIMADRLRGKPEITWDGLIWTWNACEETYPDWPRMRIERVSRKETYILGWDDFDPAFRQDAEAFGKRLSSIDLTDDGPLRPARDVTVKTRLYQIRAAGSALVLRGRDPRSIRSIADLVTLEASEEILRFFLGRHGGQTSPQVAQMAGVLRDLARHWVKVDEATLGRISRMASRVAIPRKGMTPKNRERLRPLDDPDMVARFLGLPQRLRMEAEKTSKVTRPRAILAQVAAAIALLQVAPIRRKNLASLLIDKNLIMRGDKLYLVFSEDETKNAEPIDFELPDDTVEILAWYIREHRPVLLTGQSNAVFPGEGGKAKHPSTLANQISGVMKRYLGLEFHTHLFRHAGGKLFLDAVPGQYEVVRRVLGHRSIATTTGIYAGAETRSAGLHYAKVINASRLALEQRADGGKAKGRVQRLPKAGVDIPDGQPSTEAKLGKRGGRA